MNCLQMRYYGSLYAPPKPYDWEKSLTNNTLWHWSTVTSYPDDDTLKSWRPYGNTVLFQGEIMLWKNWNLGFEPRLGLDEWNRVRDTLHSLDMRYMVYTSPSYFLKGTGNESYAVNSFKNFKGWPPYASRPFNGENMDLFMEEITRVVKELQPDGLYFDGQYRYNAAALYKLARTTRELLGEDGLMEWHSTLPLGEKKGKDLCYLPQADAYVDYILRGEHLGELFKDPVYMRYFVSGYNASNSIGVLCTRDHKYVTPEYCDILFDNNIRLHLATGKKNLRMAQYSGWVYQEEPIERYQKLYLSRLTPEIKDHFIDLSEKRQREFETKVWPRRVEEYKKTDKTSTPSDTPAVKTSVNRPSEMIQAGRSEPQTEELVDFENLQGWRLETSDGIEAKLLRTDEQIVYGKYAANITADEVAKGYIRLYPPNPIPISNGATAANMWARYMPYRYGGGPKVDFALVLEDKTGELYTIDLGHGDWGIWEFLNVTLVAPDGKRFNYEPAQKMTEPVNLKYIKIQLDPRTTKAPINFYLDSLCIYKDVLKPLNFKYSPDDLPKPTTDDTILPICKNPVRNDRKALKDCYEFVCTQGDERIVYRVTPGAGNLSDIEVDYNGFLFKPCKNGGITFKLSDEIIVPEDPLAIVEMQSSTFNNGVLKTAWSIEYNGDRALYNLDYQVRAKSLIIDLGSRKGDATKIVIGSASPMPEAKLIKVPYLRFEGESPKIVCFKNVFLSAFLDWWNSDATSLFAKSGPTEDGVGVYYNGGSEYLALTNGKYNKVKERLFINVSGDFQEVLPSLPNPKSPYLEEYRSAVWRWLYGGPTKIDWVKDLHRYGVEDFMVRFHADAMRDSDQSYSMRINVNPKVGDSLLRQAGQEIKDMGYGFAVYSCYMTAEGVNKEFDPDILTSSP